MALTLWQINIAIKHFGAICRSGYYSLQLCPGMVQGYLDVIAHRDISPGVHPVAWILATVSRCIR